MKFNTKFLVSLLALILAGYAQIAAAANSVAEPVFPIESHPYGKSYGAWGQEFVQWLFKYDLDTIPSLQPSGDVDCGKDQTGKVWFLYGVFVGSVVRNCDVPVGTAFFLSVNSSVSWVPVWGDTEEEIRADAASDLAATVSMEAAIDGVSLDPLAYRDSSPAGGFVLSIAEGSILNQFGYDAGDFYPAIVDGYWLMVPPLSVGPHTIYYNTCYGGEEPYCYDVTWNLTVVKK